MIFKIEILSTIIFLSFLSCNYSNQRNPGLAVAVTESNNIDLNKSLVNINELENADTTVHIYLTIDDGPSPYSKDIMEVAIAKSAKMSVFLVGNNMWSKKYQQYLSQYRNNPLIELGNHSYSHANGRYLHYYKNPNGVLLDFYKNIVEMKLPNSLARLPGRSFWCVGAKESFNQESGQKAAKLLKEKGFTLFGWDVEWFYNHKTGAPVGSAAHVFSEIQYSLKKNHTFSKNHCVVLLHERHFMNKKEVSLLIDMCKSAGYQFEHLKNYPMPKETNFAQKKGAIKI